MSNPDINWTPCHPYADPPQEEATLHEARALVNRLDRLAERMIARTPRLAEAIRRAAQEANDDAA